MRTINSIVLHYTDSPDVPVSTVRSWHLARGFSEVGYHKLIRRDGSVEPGRPEDQIGAHTKGWNWCSLGPCLTGSDRENWYPAAEQYASLQALLRSWMVKYNIQPANISFHREKNPTSCPGRLDKGKLFTLLGQPVSEVGPGPRQPPRGNQHKRPSLRILELKKPWMRGEDVRVLQQILREKHPTWFPDLAADGIFGPMTNQAVRVYQQNHGLIVDGRVGGQTWGNLLAT